MLDGDILRDHAVQWTLIQSLETSRSMFIAVFNHAEDIYMINSIHRKHKYRWWNHTNILLQMLKFDWLLFSLSI